MSLTCPGPRRSIIRRKSCKKARKCKSWSWLWKLKPARSRWGFKQLQPNPWSTIADKFPVGSVVDSVVIMNSNFGVFVKLEDDIEALVYSSEIDKTQAAALKAGDKLQVKIIKVDVEGMKIGVSARL